MEGPPSKQARVMAPAHASRRKYWLSDLPEGVLHRIMSFLSSREAVQTCVLSQRWRDLWRSVPRINANFFDFSDIYEFTNGVGDGTVQEDKVVFDRFLNRLVELRDPTASVQTFCLRCCSLDGSFEGSPDENRWISYALQKNARVLEVTVAQIDHLVFTSRYLRRIYFGYVFLTQGFFKQLETGCPALENLYLDECIVLDDEISSQTLKVLTIEHTEFSYDYKTSISSPSITSLTLLWPVNGIHVLKDMPSLVTASVVLNNVQDSSDFCQSLMSLSAVKNLEFYYIGRKLTIENNLQWCRKFLDLVSLTLCQWCLDANFYGLIGFLQNSPILEKLTLELDKDHWKIPQRIIGKLEKRSFTCEHLTNVEVICSEDDPLAKEVVDFFVNSGMSSGQIHIEHWS